MATHERVADPPAWMTLQRAIIGYRLSFALGVAARLGIADLLRDGPRPVEALAAACAASPDALGRVLRLLASEGFFEQRQDGGFGLTPPAELLRSDVVGSMRDRAIIEAEEWARAWAVPPGGDAYVLKFIMDDWGPGDSLRILRNCRQAMAPGGRVLINEMVLRGENAPFYGYWTDVNMLVLLGGRERNVAEYGALLAAAGLRLREIRATASDFSIVEAVASPAQERG